jgi:hypothetical protein
MRQDISRTAGKFKRGKTRVNGQRREHLTGSGSCCYGRKQMLGRQSWRATMARADVTVNTRLRVTQSLRLAA